MDKQACSEVGASLLNLRNVILIGWENLARNVIKQAEKESTPILLDHMPEIIDQLIKILQEGEMDEVELARAHAIQRAILTQYSTGDIISEFSLLRETMIDYLYPMGDIDCAKLVHKYIDILCKHSVVEFKNDQLLAGNLRKEQIVNEIKEIKTNPVIQIH